MTARTAAAFVAAAVVAGLAAGCSGSGSAAGSGGSSSSAATSARSVVAYSACLRSKGVPSFPDPDSDGNLPKGDAAGFGVSTAQLQAARTACEPLLPSGGSLNASSFRQCFLAGDCPAALVQQALTELRSFARCMRTHGVANWPDPTVGSSGAPAFDLAAHGISRAQSRSAQVGAAQRECGPQAPDVGGVPIG